MACVARSHLLTSVWTPQMNLLRWHPTHHHGGQR